MALITSAGGASYRLHSARFIVTGPTMATLDSEIQPDASKLTTTLATGAYTTDLQDGWDLERLDGGTYVTIQATLVSPNPSAFQVAAGATTNLAYQFATSGGVITVGTGTLNISIQVSVATPDGGVGGGQGGAGGGLFASPTFCSTDPNHANGFSPAIAVVVADLDGDGALDLATTTSDVIAVLPNTGLGTFGTSLNYPAGDAPYALATGDLDGDGKADLVVANYGAHSPGGVSILFNGGAGGLLPPVNYAAGVNPISIAIGDLNNDTFPDVVVANTTSGDVSVLLNRRDRTFAPAVNYLVRPALTSIAIGKLNRDAQPEVIVASAASNEVLVFANIGGGTLGNFMAFPAGGGPQSVAIGDLDGDSMPDVVTADGDGSVNVLWNLANASTSPSLVLLDSPEAFLAGAFPTAVAIGDLDGDGHPDLAVANLGGSSAGDICVLLNAGVGRSFAPAIHYLVGENPTSVALADLNRDHKIDLVATFQGGTGGLDLLLNIAPNLPSGP
jgi:hypothetical protein